MSARTARAARRPVDARRRVRLGAVLMAIALSLLAGRLVQVQAVESAGYAAVAEQKRLRTVAMPATRGTITDRSGVPLAYTVAAKRVTADPMLVADPARYAELLAPYLNVPESVLADKLADRPRRWVSLAENVSPLTWRTLSGLADPRTGRRLTGIFSEPQSHRVYPGGDLAANLLGFLGPEGRGAGGVELGYQDLLAGTDGELTYQRADDGARIATAGVARTAPAPGHDLRLTIDRDIQWYAQRKIAEQVAATGARSGTVVVERVDTGELLAVATAPTFDAADPGDAPAEDRGNRATSEVWEPGSIAKTMTMAAILQEDAATPRTRLKVPGALRRAGHVVHDYFGHSVLDLTLTGVLAKSSNVGTVLASEQLGPGVLHSYLKRFGIAAPTGLGFPGESSGLLPAAGTWSGTQQYTIPFGQGLALNAVQATGIYATIANGGQRLAPRLVAGRSDPDGEDVPASQPTRVVSERTARQVSRMLETVTADGGTASHLTIPGYRFAGKTGTAQFADPRCGCYRGYSASFAGFAPAGDPQIAMTVVLHKPKTGNSGGQLAGPVFTDVASFALRTLEVPPSGKAPEPLPMTW